MIKLTSLWIASAAALVALAGCVKETRPLPLLQATQATTEVPADQLLDVGVHVFDPGIPKAVEDDPDLADKTRIYPDIRKAEARYFAMQLRDTLEGTGNWGTARVVPVAVVNFDVTVDGHILESSGTTLTLAITATDASGRIWIDKKEYEGRADTRAYKDGYTAGRDPFENVYVAIADDLLAVRKTKTAAELANVRRISETALRQRFRARGFQPVPGAGRPRAVQNVAAAGRRRRAVAAHPPDPRARLRDDRYRQRELRVIQREARRAVHGLAALHLRRDHGRAKAEEAGPQPHGAWRRRGRCVDLCSRLIGQLFLEIGAVVAAGFYGRKLQERGFAEPAISHSRREISQRHSLPLFWPGQEVRTAGPPRQRGTARCVAAR